MLSVLSQGGSVSEFNPASYRDGSRNGGGQLQQESGFGGEKVIFSPAVAASAMGQKELADVLPLGGPA